MAPGTTIVETPPSVAVPSKSNNQFSIESALAAIEERFVQRNPKSWELHLKAVKSLPGGNTRSLLHTAPFPVFMKSGEGYKLTDEDGHTYANLL